MTATIDWFPTLDYWTLCDWTECNGPSRAAVTDEDVALADTPLCDAHLIVYLGDRIPALEHLARKVVEADPSWG
ncbi:hypothetical protein [Mycobacteroides abscessus]|uniref:hypothetical protein n=1 Tax=Mycobacteroides abscessus TaxID=36809 RepID=UPI0021054398|nr:hypothetical protein [Mycobacteroides abscessus]